jgi:hypothetical protein
MLNVLICMITRDSELMTINAMELIKRQAASDTMADCNITVSIFENDSLDGTASAIAGFDWDGLVVPIITSETLGTKKFDSVESKGRIDNIAKCRNKCMEAVGDLSPFDIVVWIDSDYHFRYQSIRTLIDLVNSEKADIASAYSLHADYARPPMELFDKWATRGEELHDWWNCTPYDLMPEFAQVYSTFNGLCAYKAGPFKDGLKFSSKSKHNDTDVEHVSICEGFRDAGLGNIILARDVLANHFFKGSNLIPWMTENPNFNN